jgi:hypothetical protein
MHSTSPTLETYRAQTWYLEQSEGAKQSKDGRTCHRFGGSAELPKSEVRPNRTFGAPLPYTPTIGDLNIPYAANHQKLA